MRPFTQTELKAIDWYTKKYNLRLMLSRPPTIYFLEEDRTEHQRLITGIVSDYKNRKEDDKELA